MFGITAFCIAAATLAAGPVADPWQREYTPAESRAAHVLALWQFNAGHELEDASGRGHSLELFGTKTIANGKFGGGLQSFPGWPVEDVRHAAVAKAHPDLSPSGPFTIDFWMRPSPDLPAGGNCHLLCKKYVSHNDYQLLLTAPQAGKRRLQLVLGFGTDSESFYSESVDWPADVWQHVAVTYDGSGAVNFHRNGESIGGRVSAGRRSISPGPLALTLGDRTGSLYSGFAGTLDQVRISRGVREFGRVRIELDLERRVFVRREAAPKAVIRITSLRPEALPQAKLTASLAGQKARDFPLTDLKPGEPQSVEFLLDTSLRPDHYELKLQVELPAADKSAQTDTPYLLTQTIPIQIVGRPVPDRMPVVQWGVGGTSNIVKQLPRLKQIGFTHCLGLDVNEHEIWNSKQPQVELRADKRREVAAALDTALAHDFKVLISLAPGHTVDSITKEFARVDRKGKTLPEAGVNGLHPRIQDYCELVGLSAGTLFAKYPAFDGALIHSELRDHAALSFSDVDKAAYRAATGQEIPAEALVKWGLDRKSLKNFPANGVIPDDDPLYRYYQWFWREGDGWPRLNTATANGLRKGAGERKDLWTFHDPAVRVASVFGSGGAVDVLSQWTYSYPEPIRIGLPTDELFAMARGAQTPQRVMKMTQLIWYRSQTAPIAKGTEEKIRSPWDDHDPDAAYITIAPMHLREAFWTKVSRPIQGIMYHGWESLVPSDEPSGYRYTHPETQHELRRLIKDVVEPFGPMLRKVPAAQHDVAFYESFAAQMFAHRGAYGWSHSWTGDCYQVLQHAGLQADVVYDETITRFGLEGYKILVIPDGDVVTQAVAERLQEFQRRGGLIVADDRLASAIKPDLKLTPLVRKKRGDVEKADLLKLANDLKLGLAGKYTWPAESSNPDVIPYRRTFTTAAPTAQQPAVSATYLFLTNDQREFGHYVGQHGLVQEAGRMSQTTVTLRQQTPGSVVYNLRDQRRVAGVTEQTAPDKTTTLTWPSTLGPCDGQIYLAVPRAISAINVDLPESIAVGSAVKCEISVQDDRGTRIPAILPLQVELQDPDGRTAEYSGHYAAVGGTLELTFDLATNDVPGAWTLLVRDLTSGLKIARELRVTAP